MPQAQFGRLDRILLLHLLEHRGQQVRFEASQWTTEFGISRKLSGEDPATLRQTLRSLEMSHLIYRRTQYVVGYSEPKHVFSLTPVGHRQALEFQRESTGDSAQPPVELVPDSVPAPDASTPLPASKTLRPRTGP